jgi:hypothetical protein
MLWDHEQGVQYIKDSQYNTLFVIAPVNAVIYEVSSKIELIKDMDQLLPKQSRTLIYYVKFVRTYMLLIC